MKKRKKTIDKPAKSCAIIAIDPGIDLGYAIFDSHEFYKKNPIILESGIIQPFSKKTKNENETTYLNRLFESADQLFMVLQRYYIQDAFIESQNFYNNAQGHAVAQRALVKLCWSTGIYASVIYNVCQLTPQMINPMLWKGQLPDSVVKKRVIDKIGFGQFKKHKIVSHAIDAVGIGLYVGGLF